MFGTIVNIFHLQEKKFKKMGELLNLDLQWKNTPYAKICVSLAACDQKLTFFGPPVISAREIWKRLITNVYRPNAMEPVHFQVAAASSIFFFFYFWKKILYIIRADWETPITALEQ